jgi:O-antigen ligase
MESITNQYQRYILISILIIFSAVVVGISVTAVTHIWGIEPQEFLALMLSFVLWFVLLRYFEVGLAILMVGFPFYALLFNVLGISTSPVSTFLFYFLTSTAVFIGTARQNITHLPLIAKKPVALLLMIFIGWMGLNWLFFSIGIQEGRDKIIFGLLLMILPYFSASLFTVENLRRFVLAVIVISTILLIISVMVFLSGVGFVNNSRFSLAENISPLGLAYFLGAGAALSFAYVVHQRRLSITLIVAIGLAGVVFVSILTLSRGPILALALSILAIAALARSSQRLRTILVFALFAVTVSSLLPLVPSLERYQYLLPVIVSLQETDEVDVQSLDIASAGRLTIWQISLSNWSNNPLTGAGLGNTRSIGFAHNFLLETLVEVGLIGFIFLLLFLIATIINLFHTMSVYYKNQTLYLATLALFVYGLTQASFSGRIQTSTILWLAAGMVNALVIHGSSNLMMPDQKEQES